MKELKVFMGPMSGSKTTAALHVARRYVRLKHTVILIRPKCSLRTQDSPGLLVTKNGETFPAIDSETVDDINSIKCDVLWIDEPFLFPDESKLFDTVQHKRQGSLILVSGIAATSELKPFGQSVPKLLAVADEIIHCKADCDHCGVVNSATRTLYCGVTEKSDIKVGGSESYASVCSNCWTALMQLTPTKRKECLI